MQSLSERGRQVRRRDLPVIGICEIVKCPNHLAQRLSERKRHTAWEMGYKARRPRCLLCAVPIHQERLVLEALVSRGVEEPAGRSEQLTYGDVGPVGHLRQVVLVT